MSRTLRNAWSRKSPLAPGELYLQTMVMTVPNTCLIDPLAVPWNAGWEIPWALVSLPSRPQGSVSPNSASGSLANPFAWYASDAREKKYSRNHAAGLRVFADGQPGQHRCRLTAVPRPAMTPPQIPSKTSRYNGAPSGVREVPPRPVRWQRQTARPGAGSRAVLESWTFRGPGSPSPRRARAYRRIQVHVLRKFAVGSLWSAGRSTRPTARCPFKVRSASATNPA